MSTVHSEMAGAWRQLTYSMRLEDVERLKEAEDDVQSNDYDAKQTDAVERQLAVTQQL